MNTVTQHNYSLDGVEIMEGRITYTRHDDTTLDVPFTNILVLEGDKIKEYKIYIDTSKLYNPWEVSWSLVYTFIFLNVIICKHS